MAIETIIVGVDFSPLSDAAQQYAYQIAERMDSKVILLHAFEGSEYQPHAHWMLRTRDFEELQQRGRHIARHQLARLAKIAGTMGRRIQTETSSLAPDAALLDAIERHRADLVVIGSHGRTGIKRLTLSRVARNIVRQSPCSVLTVRPRTRPIGDLQNILVPTDFSESAEDALSTACALARPDAHIHVLHCWMVHFYATGYHGLYEETFSIEPEIAESVRKRGKELVERYQSERFQLDFEELFASPVEGIESALQTGTYDLVVMGSHGRRGLKRVVLGSTAEATIRHANCPVLISRSGLS